MDSADGSAKLAAMEPAYERREDADRLQRHRPHLGAAMEPAYERREDRWMPGGSAISWTPQWSPPMKGGKTSTPQTGFADKSWPQWSPPMKGGKTGDTAASFNGTSRPQWSRL